MSTVKRVICLSLVWIVFFTLMVMLANMIGCVRDIHTGPSIDIDPEIEFYWNAAIVCLHKTKGYDVFLLQQVPINYFVFYEHSDSFSCDGKLANGCFGTKPPRIEYNVQTKRVITHEAAHAILWYMGDKNWREHDCD